MTKAQIYRHLAGSAASGIVALAAGYGLELDQKVVIAALFTAAPAAYSVIEKVGKRFTSEEPEVLRSELVAKNTEILKELEAKHAALLDTFDRVDARMGFIELEHDKIHDELKAHRELLPAQCDWERAGVQCSLQKGHEGRHSFEAA